MSFEQLEHSVASGKPVRLYLFSRGVQRWGYTTADRQIIHQGVPYDPVPISDSGMRQTGQLDADALEVTAPAQLAVAQLYRGVSPTAEIVLTVRDIHHGDTEALVAWIGSIYGVQWPAPDRCKIICQSLAGSMGNPGLRLTWARGCPHALYGRGCEVDKAGFAVPMTIISMDGQIIEAGGASAHDDGYFTGGFVEWSIGPALFERRTIESHHGSVLVMLGGTAGLTLGDAITAYPGCPRTIDVCDSRFDNADNYGGVPGLPGRNPFDGNPLF